MSGSDLLVLVVVGVVVVVKGSPAANLLVLVVVRVVVLAVIVTRVAFVVKSVAFQWAAFLLLIVQEISILAKQYYSAAGPIGGIYAGPIYPQAEAAAPGPTASLVELVDLLKVS